MLLARVIVVSAAKPDIGPVNAPIKAPSPSPTPIPSPDPTGAPSNHPTVSPMVGSPDPTQSQTIRLGVQPSVATPSLEMERPSTGARSVAKVVGTPRPTPLRPTPVAARQPQALLQPLSLRPTMSTLNLRHGTLVLIPCGAACGVLSCREPTPLHPTSWSSFLVLRDQPCSSMAPSSSPCFNLWYQWFGPTSNPLSLHPLFGLTSAPTPWPFHRSYFGFPFC